MKAKDIMSSPVQTIDENRSLEDAARTMLDHRIGCLPVTNEQGNLVGILTESDFAAKERGVPLFMYRFPQVLGEWLPTEDVEKIYAAARSRPVKDFMNRVVTSVEPDDDIATVLRTIQQSGFQRVPVVSGKIPVGIVSRHDLLRLLVRESIPSAKPS